ncbi:MAG: DNA-directed RNA polymerase subunit D [Nanobdellota archaeon]
MKLTKLSGDKYNLKYKIENTTPAYINSIRRFCQDYVPTLAIEDVEISQNSSVLYDELLAHRLGLVPLTTDLQSYSLPEGEEITAMSSVKLTLESNKEGYVYSEDLQTKDPKIKPAYDKIQIAYLSGDQEISLIATAVMGQGKVHAKWSPGNVYYSYNPIIKVDNKSTKLNDFIDSYPSQVVEDGEIKKENINTPELIDACDGICEDIVKVEYDDKTMIFTIESHGQLTSDEILKEAFTQFNIQLDEIKKLSGNIKN